MKSLSSVLCIGLASVGMLGPVCPAAGALRAVSALDRANGTGMGGSFTPSFTGDGRFVVFVSYANINQRLRLGI